MKKLQTISETTGLRATYANGDYTVTVFDDMDGGYDMIFCKSNTNIAHDRKNVSADELETEMRRWCADLRKWRKAEYAD